MRPGAPYLASECAASRRPTQKGFDSLSALWHLPADHVQIVVGKGIRMPKEEWGTKRVCPETGKRFYDLNKTPIVSPYTGEVIDIDAGKSVRMMVADKADKESEVQEDLVDDEDVVLDDDDDSSDVDLGDDVLEEEDDDNVSLDELADVASDDDES